MLNAASNRGRPNSGANDFYSVISKTNYYYWLIAVVFIEMIFSVTLYVIWHVIILFTWTNWFLCLGAVTCITYVYNVLYYEPLCPSKSILARNNFITSIPGITFILFLYLSFWRCYAEGNRQVTQLFLSWLVS